MDFSIKEFERKLHGDGTIPGEGTSGAKLYLERAMHDLERTGEGSGAKVADKFDGHDHLQLVYDDAIEMIRTLDRTNGDPKTFDSPEFADAKRNFEDAAHWAGFTE
jgi:hypothetical protein